MNYEYRFDLTGATQAPKLLSIPNVTFPKSAIKKGVEGTCKVELKLSQSGTVSDIVVGQSLSKDVDAAVIDSVKKIRFRPAKRNGEPFSVKMFYEFKVAAIYNERSKAVKKPKITNKPSPIYPEKYKSEKLKDKVEVIVLFRSDGTLKVLGVSSTMPKEFDQAAVNAASKLEFTPATHKKSKNKVTQKMIVEYKFKP